MKLVGKITKNQFALTKVEAVEKLTGIQK